jgi:hypothetical protein
MVDNTIDELINSLKLLKEEKETKDDKANKIINLFKSEQETFNKSSKEICENIERLKQQVNKIDERRCLFFSKLNNILTEKKQEDPSSTQETENDSICISKEAEGLKLFKKKESLLTNLLKKNNYQTIYNIFFSLLIFLLANFTLHSYIENKQSDIFPRFLVNIKGLFALTKQSSIKFIISIFYIIFFNSIMATFGKNFVKKINNFLMPFIFISLLSILFYIDDSKKFSFFVTIINYNSNVAILLKIISYYFEKCLEFSYNANNNNNNNNFLKKELKEKEEITYNYLDNKKKICVLVDNGQNLEITFQNLNFIKEIKNFTYFYFVPTFIYRDKYPMSNKINYLKILIHFTNLILSGIFIFLTIEFKFYPFFLDENYTFLKKDLILTLMVFVPQSMILLFVAFFLCSHSYLNFLAEIFKFADRNFYSDFFNAVNPNEFMLKITFYYSDFYEFYLHIYLGKYISKSLGKIFFKIIFVEYVMANCLGYFCPIFGWSMIFCFLSSYVFDFINVNQTQYFNWMFVTFLTGFCFLVAFIEFDLKWKSEMNGKNNHYEFIKNIYNGNDEMIRSFIPKFFYLM